MGGFSNLENYVKVFLRHRKQLSMENWEWFKSQNQGRSMSRFSKLSHSSSSNCELDTTTSIEYHTPYIHCGLNIDNHEV